MYRPYYRGSKGRTGGALAIPRRVEEAIFRDVGSRNLDAVSVNFGADVGVTGYGLAS